MKVPPATCPLVGCDSLSVSASRFFEISPGRVVREVTCNVCEFVWVETFDFVRAQPKYELGSEQIDLVYSSEFEPDFPWEKLEPQPKEQLQDCVDCGQLFMGVTRHHDGCIYETKD